MNAKILKADAAGIQKAGQLIQQGGIAAFPTETFYGLGADARNEEALQKVFRLKGREENKPLLLLIGEREWLSELVRNIPPVAERLIEKFWPGPLTLVFAASPGLSNLLTAGTGTIGVRISPHPIARALVLTVGRAITATSANLSGQPSTSLAVDVSRFLGGKVDVILDGGQTPGGMGSTVLDVSGPDPKLIRPGAISQTELTPFIKPHSLRPPRSLR
jgi:L-threonylcarbamoyladenylate synthase